MYDLEGGLQPKVPKRNYLNLLFSLSYFCLDTKVPKNQGKKNTARSAKQLTLFDLGAYFLKNKIVYLIITDF